MGTTARSERSRSLVRLDRRWWRVQPVRFMQESKSSFQSYYEGWQDKDKDSEESDGIMIVIHETNHKKRLDKALCVALIPSSSQPSHCKWLFTGL